MGDDGEGRFRVASFGSKRAPEKRNFQSQINSGDSFRKSSNDLSMSGEVNRLEMKRKPSEAEGMGDASECEEVICLFKTQQRLFTFRSKHAPVGQYEFPFYFRLPESLPSTFQFVNEVGENYQVKFSVTCSFDDMEPLLHFEKEIIVLQTNEDRKQLKKSDKEKAKSNRRKHWTASFAQRHVGSSNYDEQKNSVGIENIL